MSPSSPSSTTRSNGPGLLRGTAKRWCLDDIATARKQVESLGGRWSAGRHHYDEGIVMVMHDPEEHEFCIVQYYRSAPGPAMKNQAGLRAKPAD